MLVKWHKCNYMAAIINGKTVLMYIINKMLYKGFISETEQSYTNVCRKCMSNNTSIQKKNTFCALQTLNKMNKMETTQHKYYTD